MNLLKEFDIDNMYMNEVVMTNSQKYVVSKLKVFCVEFSHNEGVMEFEIKQNNFGDIVFNASNFETVDSNPTNFQCFIGKRGGLTNIHGNIAEYAKSFVSDKF